MSEDRVTYKSADEQEQGLGWCIVELMGHRKLGARVTEATLGGGAFLRLDVPGDGADVATQFVAPGAVYAITPCSEDVARRLARACRPEPVTRWELPEPARQERPELGPPTSPTCSSCQVSPCDCELPY